MCHGKRRLEIHKKCFLVALKENEALWKPGADMKMILEQILELHRVTGVTVSLISVKYSSVSCICYNSRSVSLQISTNYFPPIIKLQCDSSIIKLQCESSIIKLQCDSSIIKPHCDSSIIKLQCDPSIIKLQRESSIIKLQCDSSIIKLQCDSPVMKLQCDSSIIKL
jgi:hypothetical protein